MIQSIENSSAHAATGGAAAPSATSGGTSSFASALASAQSGADPSSGTVSGGLNTDLKPPKGETWGPVPGHTDYADILSGPRNGFYVSLVGPRKGQPFVIVREGGKVFHVYGQGKHKVSIEVRPNPADLKPAEGETWQPVTGHHDFKKISGGKRSNQFVNLSGNERTGETFRIAHHDGKTWHVYGSGKHRTEVAVGGHRHKPQAPATNGNPSQPG